MTVSMYRSVWINNDISRLGSPHQILHSYARESCMIECNRMRSNMITRRSHPHWSNAVTHIARECFSIDWRVSIPMTEPSDFTVRTWHGILGIPWSNAISSTHMYDKRVISVWSVCDQCVISVWSVAIRATHDAWLTVAGGGGFDDPVQWWSPHTVNTGSLHSANVQACSSTLCGWQTLLKGMFCSWFSL